MRKRLPLLSLCTLVAVLLGCTGYWLLFTTFMNYDDEGYVLWSMRQFCEGHPLYTDTFSQYGPMFYAWHGLWHAAIGFAFDSESARWLTLAYWLGAAGACGHMAWRLTRNGFAAIGAGILSFAALQEMIREPFHPGGFLTAITAVGAAICLAALMRNAHRVFVIAGALAGTAMALTKINVGVLFLIGVGSWMAMHSGNRKWGWAALVLTGLGIVAAPMALMKAYLHEGWVRNFALVFAASGLAALVPLHARRRADFTVADWLWMIATAGIVTASMVAFCTFTGTPIGRFWEGVVTAPLRHAGLNILPIQWRSGAVACAILSLVMALVHFARPWRPTVIAWLRLLGGLAVLVQLTGFGFEKPFHTVFQFAPALAWLMATPLIETPESGPATRGRSWLAWCAIWETLQAFPVGGSQVAWGSFLFVPLLVAGGFDAICFLLQHASYPRLATQVADGAVLGIAAVAHWHLGSEGLLTYLDREPLGLPGARSIRLSGSLTSELRIMSRNAAMHAGLLFSAPGLFSFNIWSEKPTPTAANVTAWGALLESEQKKAIYRRLSEDRTSMIAARLAHGKPYNPDNFLAYFQTVLSVGDYSLLAGNNKAILPLGTVRLEETQDGRAFFVIVASPTQRRVAGLQIRGAERHGVAFKTDIPSDTGWRITPVNLKAQPTGETRSETAPFLLPEYSLVQVAINPMIAKVDLDKIEIVLTDPDGVVVESFRFNKFSDNSEFVPR